MPIRPFLAGQDLTERASPKCHSRMNLVTPKASAGSVPLPRLRLQGAGLRSDNLRNSTRLQTNSDSDDSERFSLPHRLLRCWCAGRKLAIDVGAEMVPAIGVRTEIVSAGKRSIESAAHHPPQNVRQNKSIRKNQLSQMPLLTSTAAAPKAWQR